MTDRLETPIDAIATALAVVQADLSAVPKSGTGNFGKYVTLADAMDILPKLAAAGLVWIAMPTHDEHDNFVLRYELRHTSGASIVGTYPLPSGTPQQQGSAITYARRYAFCAVIGIAGEDDDGQAAKDTDTSNKRQQRPPQRPSAPREQPQEARSTGGTVNLQKLMLSELEGPQRPAFMAWLSKEHDCTPTQVPKAVEAQVEAKIQQFATGEVTPAEVGTLEDPF